MTLFITILILMFLNAPWWMYFAGIVLWLGSIGYDLILNKMAATGY